MHVNDRRARSGALSVIAVAVLLAVVAIASSGRVPTGSTGTRGPAGELADTLLSLLVVLMLAGAIGAACLYYLRRTNLHEERRQGRRGRNWRPALVALVVVALLVALTTIPGHGRPHLPGRHATPTSAAGGKTGHGSSYTPRFAPVPVAVVVGAAVVAAFAAYLARRARRRALQPLAGEASLALTLADVLGETLDDLRAEPDPRIAVIAAYARLERTLAALGLPRRESDAPLEYLRRVLVDLEIGAAPVSRLTELFELAKFSTGAVGPESKDEAIALLESMRADLQAAEAERAETVLSRSTFGQPA